MVETIGSVKSERAVSLIALETHHIPHVFSPAALERGRGGAARSPRAAARGLARAASSSPSIRPTPRTTTTRSTPRPIPIPKNPGGFIVTVAIADVAAYVRPGSALDRDALERGNSVYFPDRVVPMLPERISNDLCSLRAHEDRPALAVRMVLGADGRKRSHAFHRIMMRSAAKLSYEQAQAAIDGRPDETTEPLLDTVLKPLYAAHSAIRIERERRDPLDLDLPERKLVLDSEGRLDGVRWPERLEAHRLIEEFMILANVAAAETLEAQRSPLLYRAHDAPSAEKLDDLVEFLRTIGVKLAQGERVRPAHFNGVLDPRARPGGRGSRQRGRAARPGAGRIQPRELRPFRPQSAPLRAFHLAHPPLRRSRRPSRADPRAQSRRGGLDDMRAGELAQIAEHISAAERRAMAAERETVDRLVAAHLADRVGAVFAARIAGVTRAGLFVKLTETGADGFVPAATLGRRLFPLRGGDPRRWSGRGPGETFQLGDAVEVRLVEAAPFAGALQVRDRALRLRAAEVRKPERARRRACAVRKGEAPMNDMSRIWRIPTPPPERPLGEAIGARLLGRCPACGRGRLFRAYLKLATPARFAARI